MNVETIHKTGQAEVWDTSPEQLDRIKILAGNQFAGVYNDLVVIHRPNGTSAYVQPGWYVIRWNGHHMINIQSDVAFITSVKVTE